MDVVEKITGLGFELDSYSLGKHECTCPFCSHTRKPIHQKQKCAAVWIEDDFATYNCVHCGEHGFVNADKPSKNPTYVRPVVPKHDDDNLVLASAFFESRGIRLETARKFGVYVEKDKFRVPVLAFPFYKGEQLVNVKYRGLNEKRFAQEKNPEPVVFGYDKCFGQKEIIVVEGECFTGDTQVLTERGWVDFSDYHGQRVVQVNKDLTAELVEPIAVVKKPYSGDLLARKTKNMDLLATPGHNIVYVSGRKGVCKRKFCEMPRAIEGVIPTAVRFNSKNQIPLLDDELRLWVAISADGSIDRNSTTGHIRAAFKKKRKIDRFEQLLVSCKLNYTKTKQRNGYTYFGFCWTNVTKIFPMGWMFFMSAHQRDILLKELIFWDGNTVPNRSMTEYSTKLYENAVFVQTLCHLSGFNSSIVYRHNEHGNWFKVTILWDKSHVSWQFKNQPEHKNYDGTVYCVQVPSGMILVRRNEKIMVVGNCDVLAFAEVGIENVVSIPSGSIGQPVDKDYKGAKFDFLKVSQPLFDIADRVILALDSDAPGQYMTQALIDRLGKEKCWTVDWSVYKVKGKDANDFLLVDKSILPDAIANAKPIPLRGIVNAGDDMDAFEVYVREGINSSITTGFDNLDELIKFEYGNFVTITGYPGCLSWNTKIRINRERHGKVVTIRDLYQRFNGLDPRYKWKDSPTYIRRYVNGKIVLSKIEAVTYSGVKPTMELTLDDGKVLRATPDHRILTTNGYKQLQALTTDDFVIVDNIDKKPVSGRTIFKRYKERTVGSLHPYAKYHPVRDKNGKVYGSWRVPEHRLVYEAAQNGISVRELIMKTHKDVSGLTFVNPKEFVIHHKDGDPTNNTPDNLEAVTEREHLVKRHSCANNLKQGIPDIARVVSVHIAGIGPTYDIQCETIPDNEPNFNANGIMVHNSGKSLFATDLIMNLAELHNMKTLYCAFENNPNQLKKKWLQMKIGRSVMNADDQTIEEIRQHYQFLKEHFFILQDYTTSLTVDEILDMAQQAIRRYNIGCVIIDPLNKLTFNKSSNFTEDIGELLTKLIIFAKRNNVLMFLVAHPTKPADGQRKLGAQSTPSGFDIAGSANFLNMSDVIMTVHRKQDEFGNKSQSVRILISKVRDTDFGHEGSCYFVYNPSSGRYFPTTATEFESENLDPTIRTKEWLSDV